MSSSKQKTKTPKVSCMTVHSLADLAGISVRTLHYYDEIGLLVPSGVSDSGYRLYGDKDLERLQEIMLFRELEFPLKDIKRIIDNPGFDKSKALEDQIRILEMKRRHLDDLIDHALRMKAEEELKMDFKAYDTRKIEEYKKLAREAWGDTAAYKEYEEKASKQSDVEKRQASEDLMNIFFEFGEMKTCAPAAPKVQAQVKKLQDFITEKYYKCTDEILAGLGQLYAAGGEMTQNIDVAGGRGCAQFVSEAIEEYCAGR